jgi:hypothetical protein
MGYFSDGLLAARQRLSFGLAGLGAVAAWRLRLDEKRRSRQRVPFPRVIPIC